MSLRYKEADNMLNELEKNEIGCVFLKEPTEFVKNCLHESLRYTEPVLVQGSNSNITVIIYELHYSDKIRNDVEKNLLHSRYNCVKEIYYRWCLLKKHEPNDNEGWFRSKRFAKYLQDIDYHQMNYVIVAQS